MKTIKLIIKFSGEDLNLYEKCKSSDIHLGFGITPLSLTDEQFCNMILRDGIEKFAKELDTKLTIDESVKEAAKEFLPGGEDSGQR